MPEEPDDARLTGGTRSLSRRLLALNIPGLVAPKIQAAPDIRGASRKSKARKVALTSNDLVPHDA